MLSKIPGYPIVKSIAADFSGTEREEGLRPALVNFDDNQVLGFVVEYDAAERERVTVFVPSAPAAASGSVVLVPRERVEWLDVSTATAMWTTKQRGLGLQQFVRPPPARASDAGA